LLSEVLRVSTTQVL